MLYNGIATINLLHWQISGELLFIVIIRGAHNFFGPIAGTPIYFALRNSLKIITNHRNLFYILFLLLVHFALEGSMVFADKKVRSVFNVD